MNEIFGDPIDNNAKQNCGTNEQPSIYLFMPFSFYLRRCMKLMWTATSWHCPRLIVAACNTPNARRLRGTSEQCPESTIRAMLYFMLAIYISQQDNNSRYLRNAVPGECRLLPNPTPLWWVNIHYVTLWGNGLAVSIMHHDQQVYGHNLSVNIGRQQGWAAYLWLSDTICQPRWLWFRWRSTDDRTELTSSTYTDLFSGSSRRNRVKSNLVVVY